MLLTPSSSQDEFLDRLRELTHSAVDDPLESPVMLCFSARVLSALRAFSRVRPLSHFEQPPLAACNQTLQSNAEINVGALK